jgi:hypothetical protein
MVEVNADEARRDDTYQGLLQRRSKMEIARLTIFSPKEEAQWDSTLQKRVNTKQHKYYCGIDLHARSMYIGILGDEEKPVLNKSCQASPEAFLKAIEPYRSKGAKQAELWVRRPSWEIVARSKTTAPRQGPPGSPRLS